MNHKLANGMKMWKENGNITTLFFSLKGLEILHQEGRGQVKTMVMEHFNGILFHKSGPANKQHTNQSIITNQEISCLIPDTLNNVFFLSGLGTEIGPNN
jgi:hypothetical protein